MGVPVGPDRPEQPGLLEIREPAMYSRISIRNFRGIELLDAERPRRINLIVGTAITGARRRFSRAYSFWGGATPTLSCQQHSVSYAASGWEEPIPDPVWRFRCRILSTPRSPWGGRTVGGRVLKGADPGDRGPTRNELRPRNQTHHSGAKTVSRLQPKTSSSVGWSSVTDRGGDRDHHTRAIFDPKSGSIDAAPQGEDPAVPQLGGL